MPEISLFYGIRITMYWNEHNPPHFHVEYSEYNATVLIQDCIIDIINGVKGHETRT